MYLAYALTVTYSPNLSLPIALTCMVCQNFPPPKIFRVWYLYLNTSKSTCILLKYFSQNNTMYLYLYFTKCQSICTLLKYFHMYFAPCLVCVCVCARVCVCLFNKCPSLFSSVHINRFPCVHTFITCYITDH